MNKFTESKIREAIESLEIDDFEIKSIEYNPKGWWDVEIKTFYGCWLSEIAQMVYNLGLNINDNDIIIAPIDHDFIGISLSIFEH